MYYYYTHRLHMVFLIFLCFFLTHILNGTITLYGLLAPHSELSPHFCREYLCRRNNICYIIRVGITALIYIFCLETRLEVCTFDLRLFYSPIYLCARDTKCYIIRVGITALIYISCPDTRLKVCPLTLCLFYLLMLHVYMHSLMPNTYTTTPGDCIVRLSHLGRVVFLNMHYYSRGEVYTHRILLSSLSMLHIHKHNLV